MTLALAAEPAQPAASSVRDLVTVAWFCFVDVRQRVISATGTTKRKQLEPLGLTSTLGAAVETVLFYAQVRMGIFKRLFGGFGVKKKAGRKKDRIGRRRLPKRGAARKRSGL